MGPFIPLLAAAGGVLLVYLLTLKAVHTWDAMAYTARAIGHPLLSERYTSTRLFHPHHLLYVPFAMGTRALLPPSIASTDPMRPLQIANALLGSVVSLLAGAIVLRVSGDRLRSVLAILLVGFSNGVWAYATEVEVMIPALACLLLGTYWLLWDASPARALIAGLSLSAAVVLHQLVFLISLSMNLCLALLAQRKRVPRGVVRPFLLSTLIPPIVLYVTVGVVAAGAHSPTQLLDWALSARGRSTFGRLGPDDVVTLSARGVLDSFCTLGPFDRWRHFGERSSSAPVEGLAVVLCAVGLGLLFGARLGGLARRLRALEPTAVVLTTGLLTLVTFVVWYQPINADYWVYVPPLLVVLLFTGVDRESGPRRAIAVPLIVLLALVNLVGRALPQRDASRAPYADLVRFASRHFSPGDMLLHSSAEGDLAEGLVAVPLFTSVEVVPVPSEDEGALWRGFTETIPGRLATSDALGHAVYADEETIRRLQGRARVRFDAVPTGELRSKAIHRLLALEAEGG